MFLHIELLGKRIQEQLYFNNIVSTKFHILQIEWYGKRNQTLSNLWLEDRWVVSEEHLQQAPHIN